MTLRALRFLTILAVFTGLLSAQTEDRVRKSIPVQSATRLGFEVDFGSIVVDEGSSAAIEVEAFFAGNPPSQREFDRMLNDFYIDVDRTGSTVRVKGHFKDGWKSAGVLDYVFTGTCKNGKCLEYARWLRRTEFRLKVPPQLAVDLHTSGGSIQVSNRKGEVSAHTSGGSLRFGDIDGPVLGETSGGSITLQGGRGKATVRTSGGSIRIDSVAGDVDAETSGGSIDILKTTGHVMAHTSGGSIHVGHAVKSVDASTSGGGIIVAMASNAPFDVDAETSGGGVSSDFRVDGASRSDHRHRLRGAVNGGGPLLRLRTSGGGIHIRRATT